MYKGLAPYGQKHLLFATFHAANIRGNLNRLKMKKLALFTISILTIFQGVKSQNYVAFPTEGAHWNVYLEYSIQQNPPNTL